ncbi:hypothetical protein NEMBOFW57_007668 [Staphylotrichum longicolle]|uniref:TNT domain-containing protein n=1 Tax=Staphylotrichum longicolle TaxID=669026 RepID=A0AAD4EVM5_9PEZI|nr:hypothetical protein NEMBOFW57_007668 [Staphylotrichum longicolle]
MHLPVLTLLLALLPPALTHPTKSPRDTTSRSCGRRNTPRYCAGTNHTPALLQTYICGDSRLGPTRLPSASDDLPVAPVLATALFGYDRFAGSCPGDFLKEWFDEASGWCGYPPQSGFTLTAAVVEGGEQGQEGGGKAIQGNVTLREETVVDRFGSEYGSFVSPAGAGYAARALPPSNLVGGDVA